MPILIVDDEKDIRDSLRDLLRIAGYNVVTAASGKEALDCIEKQKIGLMLVDLSMPGMDGESLIGELGRLKKMPPSIVITALAPWQTVNLVKRGIGYLRKPIDLDLLLGAVRTYIGKEGGNGSKKIS
jgi:two-component system phosphate regulon sensor histidine kinase PhoR